jgi:hypothetical protein
VLEKVRPPSWRAGGRGSVRARKRGLHTSKRQAIANNHAWGTCSPRQSTVARFSRPLRVVVKPSTGGKWSAELDGEVLCVASAPLVTAARILIGKGADPTRIIELWHQGADTWALRGRLGAIAEVRLAGERRASHSARNGSPVDFRGEGAP